MQGRGAMMRRIGVETDSAVTGLVVASNRVPWIGHDPNLWTKRPPEPKTAEATVYVDVLRAEV